MGVWEFPTGNLNFCPKIFIKSKSSQVICAQFSMYILPLTFSHKKLVTIAFTHRKSQIKRHPGYLGKYQSPQVNTKQNISGHSKESYQVSENMNNQVVLYHTKLLSWNKENPQSKRFQKKQWKTIKLCLADYLTRGEFHLKMFCKGFTDLKVRLLNNLTLKRLKLLSVRFLIL